MKRLLVVLSVVSLLMASPVLALELHQARQSGLVGEKSDGYVAAVKSTPEVEAFVADVNSKRLQEYTRISQAKHQAVDVVAKLAAPQIISKLDPGSYYQDADGNWIKR